MVLASFAWADGFLPNVATRLPRPLRLNYEARYEAADHYEPGVQI
jgi:hypothetical protein